MKLPRRRHRSVLGLDVGVDAARLVLVDSHGGKGHEVQWAREIDLTEFQGFADFDTVSGKIDEALRDVDLRRVDVAATPPWGSARIALEEMPAMDSEKLARASEWYFRRHLPEDMTHPVFHAIGQPSHRNAEGADVMDSVMVFMDDVIVSGVRELSTKLGGRLRWLSSQPHCFRALLAHLGQSSSNTLLLDVGAGQSRLYLFSGGSIRLARKLTPCANDVRKAVAESNGLTWQQASWAMLATSGVGPLAADDAEGLAAQAHDKIIDGFGRLADRLAGEVERSTAYLAARDRLEVDHVVLAGGISDSPAFRKALDDRVSLDCIHLDPHLGLDAESHGHFAPALGAALSALRDDPTVNILSALENQTKHSISLPQTPRKWAAVAAVAGALLGVAGFDVAHTIERNRLVSESEDLESRIEDLRYEAQELTRHDDILGLEDEIQSLRDIYATRAVYTPFFGQVVDILPNDVWLTHVSIERKQKQGTALPNDDDEEEAENAARDPHENSVLVLTLRGRGQSVESLGSLVLALERRDMLESIQVLDIHESTDTGPGRYSFEISGEPLIPTEGTDVEPVGPAR